MRKVSKSNKMNFIVFGIMTALIISVFLLFITRAMSKKKTEVPVSAGTVTYDEKNNYIKADSEGTVKKFWDGNWRLELKDKTYDLGKNNMLYDPKVNSLITVGNVYKVLDDASVVPDGNGNSIQLGKGAEMYKMADRKYVVLSPDIKLDEEALSVKKYLMIDIDKNGNSHLYNNEVSRKFLEPVKVVFGTYEFNVAEEFLNIGNQKIDMAKIGGTTNEYFQIAANDKENKEKTEGTGNQTGAEPGTQGSGANQVANANGQNGATNTSNSTTNSTNNANNATTTISVGGGGGGGTGSGNTADGVVGNGNAGGGATQSGNRPTGASDGRISSIIPDVQGITVNFTINDVENRYSDVALDLKHPDGKVEEILIRKEDNYRTIYNLQPNAKYEVTLNAIVKKVADGETKLEKELLDKGKIETKSIRADFSLTKLSKTKLSFNLKVKDGIILTKGNVVLYGDDEEIGRKELNARQAIDGKGWDSSFEVEDIDTIEEFKLVLEDTELNGEVIKVNSARVFVNSFFGSILRMLSSIFGG